MTITRFDDLFNSLATIGLDAMQRVLRKVRKEGGKSFGHSYKKSIDSPIHETGGHL